MKILRLGDPHVRPNNIEEANKLMAFVRSTAIHFKVDGVEILGDLFHTHAVIRLEVLEFWRKWFRQLGDLPVTVLVGNHDKDGDYGSNSHALSVFKREQGESPEIIDKAQQIGIYAYMPFYHDTKQFVIDANKMAANGAKVLVCHQTFAGSQYETGFYSPDGINPDELNFDTIISGHIHKEQICGKVDYPGTAKWDTIADANEDKGIWIYEHDDITGKVLSRTKISTKDIVTPIISLTWKEGEEAPIVPEKSKVAIELIGSSDWVSKQKKTLKGKVSIQTKITDQKRASSRKAGNSLEFFISNMYPTTMDRENLMKVAKELGIV